MMPPKSSSEEPRSNEEWITHVLNIHGTFFERRCQQVLSEAQNWSVKDTNYPVEFPPPYDAIHAVRGKTSNLDIWATHQKATIKLTLLLECKKNNPDFIDWIFFEEVTPKAPFTRVIRHYMPGSPAHADLFSGEWWGIQREFRELKTNLVVSDDARETKGDYLALKRDGKLTKTENSSITEAAFQIALATQAIIHQEERESDILRRSHPIPTVPYIFQVFLPTIITTARLFTCHFKTVDIDLRSGLIPRDATTFTERPYLLYTYPLPPILQLHPGDSLGTSLVMTQLDKIVRMPILVVQSAALPTFLAALPKQMTADMQAVEITLPG